MIDASQLKDSVEMENDIVTKEIKSNSKKYCSIFQKLYRRVWHTFLRRIERKFDSFNPRMILKTMMNTEINIDVDKYYINIVNELF